MGRSLQDRIRDAVWRYADRASAVDAPPEGPTDPIVSVPGTVVVGGHSNRVSVNVAFYSCAPRITDRQMAELTRLVRRIVSLGGGSYGKVWGRLKGQFSAAAARNIEQRDYEAARAYLDRWLRSLEPPPPDRRR